MEAHWPVRAGRYSYTALPKHVSDNSLRFMFRPGKQSCFKNCHIKKADRIHPEIFASLVYSGVLLLSHVKQGDLVRMKIPVWARASVESMMQKRKAAEEADKAYHLGQGPAESRWRREVRREVREALQQRMMNDE